MPPKVPKSLPEHKDKLGRILKIGDCVAYPDRNSLEVGTIKKLNNIMVKVSRLGKNSYRSDGQNKYPADVVLLDGPDVMMYVLKMNS